MRQTRWSDYNECRNTQAATAIIQRARCPESGDIYYAPSPFLNSSSLGPNLHATVSNMIKNGSTDERIVDFIHAEYGFEMSPNMIWNTRKAQRSHLNLDLIPSTRREIQHQPAVQMDEGRMKRGDGQYGYVWVVHTPVAVFLKFTPTRSATVLDVHFDWLRNMPIARDGYLGHPLPTDILQRDFVHLLRMAEKLAAIPEIPADEAR